MLKASFGDVDPQRLFDLGSKRQQEAARPAAPGSAVDALTPSTKFEAAHHADISCFAILREAPIRAVALTLLLEILAEHCGADLLRLKGIVNIAESPDRPAVIHGVQHVFHPPAWLERWPPTTAAAASSSSRAASRKPGSRRSWRRSRPRSAR